MLDKLREIETTAVEKLVKLKKEADRIKGFSRKADEMRSDVASGIFARVVDDYEQREQALEAEAEPLRVEAREQYAKLRSIFEEINEGLDKARAEKEELEFRHAVGELTKKQLTQALGASAETLETHEKELAEANKLKDKFLAAFDSEEHLEAGESSGEASESSGEASESSGEAGETSGKRGAPADEEGVDDTETDVYATIEAPLPDDLTMLPGESADKTVVFDDAPGSEADPPTGEGTVLVPSGCLIQMDNGESSVEFRLGAVNYVGRAPDNHVCIEAPAVSRRHALVAASADGFTLKDLDSPNGTYVNEDRIGEVTLSDGDRIKIGDVELLFRSQ